jgi:DNA-binding NarL/FixJ family response regulator
MSVRILIVDDHAIVRAGLRALLNTEPDFQVVGEALDGRTAVALAAQLTPDVIVIDINMPQMNGIETTKQIMEQLPGARVLILTLHADASYLRQAIEYGAVGYVLKSAIEPQIISAIRTVANGDMFIDPAMTLTLVRNMALVDQPKANNASALTPRETDILRLVARGFTSREIAEQLHLSVRTIEGHRANLFGRLGLSTPIQIARYAMQHGLLDEQ